MLDEELENKCLDLNRHWHTLAEALFAVDFELGQAATDVALDFTVAVPDVRLKANHPVIKAMADQFTDRVDSIWKKAQITLEPNSFLFNACGRAAGKTYLYISERFAIA